MSVWLAGPPAAPAPSSGTGPTRPHRSSPKAPAPTTTGQGIHTAVDEERVACEQMGGGTLGPLDSGATGATLATYEH